MGKDGVVLVSEQGHGTGGFNEILLRHHGQEARRPQRPEWNPGHEHLDWHVREVSEA